MSEALEETKEDRIRNSTVSALRRLADRISVGELLTQGYDHQENDDLSQTFKVELTQGPNF